MTPSGIVERFRSLQWRDVQPYLWAALVIVVASAVGIPVRERLGILNISLILVLVCLGLGLFLGTRPAAFGAALAFVSLDFLFIPPYHTLTIAEQDHVLGLFAYLGVAVVSAILVGRLREARDDAIRESRRNGILYQLNRSLIGDAALDSLLRSIVRSVVDVYGCDSCRILTIDAGTGELETSARWPEAVAGLIDRQAAAMARHAIDSRRPAGLGQRGRRIVTPHGTIPTARTPRMNTSGDVLYLPVSTPDRVIGVLEVTGRRNAGRFDAEDERLLGTFADQVALAVERTRLTAEATRASALEQANDLKSSLLAAVSHDLRTPLAAIKASSSALLDAGIAWSEQDRTELLTAIDEEVDRLTQMVSNLLDLSRIEGGALRPDKDWQDVPELVRDVMMRTARQTAHHRVHVHLEQELPVIFLDYVEIAQVLINLIANAVKYAPAGESITIDVHRNHSFLRFSVTDTGPGIAPTRLPYIFDSFYRAHEGGTVSGSGIGLAICKGLVEAHHGRIWAHSAPGIGTSVIFELPIDGEPADEAAT